MKDCVANKDSIIANLDGYFDTCDYAEDFQADIDIADVFDCFSMFDFSLWLKAYDTSCKENAKETYLHEHGYRFDCYVWIMDNESCTMVGDTELLNFPSKNKSYVVSMFKELLANEGYLRKCIESRLQ